MNKTPQYFSPGIGIGIFDSGVGGLTVLRELQCCLPDVPLRYIADTAHAPYGQRSPDFIARRSLLLSQHLVDHGARLLVVACNTATAHSIQALRQRWPSLPIVGTEPGIKPAVAASRNGRIGVLATSATLASGRFADLLARHAAQSLIVSQGCPGLADLIETGDFEAPALRQMVTDYCRPLRAAGVDTVLMGCTHYPFIQAQLQAELGSQVQLLNIESAVAQQAQRLWADLNLNACAAPVSIATSGDAAELARFVHHALGWNDVTMHRLAI
jgi:glutamate racemase